MNFNLPINTNSWRSANNQRHIRCSSFLLFAMALLGTPTLCSASETSLVDAAERADLPRVQQLLSDKTILTSAQADGMTALHWAVQHDDVAMVTALIAAGADIKTANNYNVTPLSIACTNGNDAIVTALLKAGADANTTLTGGETVLMTAARTGRITVVQTLLNHKAKIDAADRNDQTALMWAANDGHADVVTLLIKSGADYKIRLKSGFNAFLFAVRQGHSEVVQALLKAGANVNDAIDTKKKGGRGAPNNNTSALIIAIENGHFELAVLLIKAGANPNDRSTDSTPLHTMTTVRKPPRGDGQDGQPPPDGSGKLTSLDFIRQIIALGAEVNATLSKGNQNTLSLNGATPFLMASKNADLPRMTLFVELGADPLRPNKNGSTPLMVAAGLGCAAAGEEAGSEPECLEAVTYLRKLGADVNTVDANNETAMHGAAYKNQPKIIQWLADNGAKIEIWNSKNKSGWTPLLIAEGYRPGNFKPSEETIAAIHKVMIAAGMTPPPPTERTDPTKGPKGYGADAKVDTPADPKDDKKKPTKK